jgi:hypothetical protein
MMQARAPSLEPELLVGADAVRIEGIAFGGCHEADKIHAATRMRTQSTMNTFTGAMQQDTSTSRRVQAPAIATDDGGMLLPETDSAVGVIHASANIQAVRESAPATPGGTHGIVVSDDERR